MTGTDRMADIRPQASATAAFTPSTRGPKASAASASQPSSAVAFAGSRGRTPSMPLRISPSVSALRKRSLAATVLDGAHDFPPGVLEVGRIERPVIGVLRAE